MAEISSVEVISTSQRPRRGPSSATSAFRSSLVSARVRCPRAAMTSATSCTAPPTSCASKRGRPSSRRARRRSRHEASNEASAATAASCARPFRAATTPTSARRASARSATRSTSAGSAPRRGQSSCGRRLIMVSIISGGAGSVGVSARPAFPTTEDTSGNERRTSSRNRRSFPACSIEVRAIEVGISRIVPSSRGGMNSRPSRGASSTPTRTRTKSSQRHSPGRGRSRVRTGR